MLRSQIVVTEIRGLSSGFRNEWKIQCNCLTHDETSPVGHLTPQLTC
jgi:hypothetical protein